MTPLGIGLQWLAVAAARSRYRDASASQLGDQIDAAPIENITGGPISQRLHEADHHDFALGNARTIRLGVSICKPSSGFVQADRATEGR
jgi:hypothetical protein